MGIYLRRGRDDGTRQTKYTPAERLSPTTVLGRNAVPPVKDHARYVGPFILLPRNACTGRTHAFRRASIVPTVNGPLTRAMTSIVRWWFMMVGPRENKRNIILLAEITTVFGRPPRGKSQDERYGGAVWRWQIMTSDAQRGPADGATSKRFWLRKSQFSAAGTGVRKTTIACEL